VRVSTDENRYSTEKNNEWAISRTEAPGARKETPAVKGAFTIPLD
jgi:hypothetical protein